MILIPESGRSVAKSLALSGTEFMQITRYPVSSMCTIFQLGYALTKYCFTKCVSARWSRYTRIPIRRANGADEK